MNARVTVLQPADGLVYKWSRKRTKRIPLGMAYIATAALRKGYDVKVVDASLDDDAVSSGNRPHIPYLLSEEFKSFRASKKEGLEEYTYDDYNKRYDEVKIEDNENT